MRTSRNLNYSGDVYIEATVKVRLLLKDTRLYTENEWEYLTEGLCNGDIQAIDSHEITKFNVENIQTY